MKKFILAALLALPLATLAPQPAKADGFRLHIGCWTFGFGCGGCGGCGGCCGGGTDFGIGCNGCIGGGTFQLAPWYLYWPMGAHFQMPAPTGFPNGAAPMVPTCSEAPYYWSR
jgi:hypothetical protein